MIRMSIKLDSIVLHRPVNVEVAFPSVLSFKKKLKVVWALHPAFNDATIFFERLNALDIVESKNVVFIAPSLNNSYFVNSELDNVGDFLDSELVHYLRGILPISSQKADNVCLGISMGAYGALSWGLRCQDYFNRLILISGYYDNSLTPDKRLNDNRRYAMVAKLTHPYMEYALFDKIGNLKDNTNLRKLIDDYDSKNPVTIDFYCGDDDVIAFEQTQYYFNMIKNKDIITSCTTICGEHNVKTWRDIFSIL